MQTFGIRHVTTYRYANPVTFGDHRLMVRPRGSHDMKLRSSTLTISPPPTSVRWLHDVFGNSIAVASFEGSATELSVISELTVEHYPLEEPDYTVEGFARTYPFSYAAEEAPDLGRTMLRHYPDPEHKVDEWAKTFVLPDAQADGGLVETRTMLERMTMGIKEGFTYAARDAEGTQSPVETLETRSGSCRDFALLMMEAVRSLGLAARFVSGYLYDPAVDGAEAGTVGAGATHAWVQVYLPGAGWVEFDPTNGIIGGKHLLRVAVSRDPSQAIPVSGSWFGAPADFLGMTVEVSVTANP